MEGFEIIETTADIGIKSFGKDEKELLDNALHGLYSFCINSQIRFDSLIFTAGSDFILLKGETLEKLFFNLMEESVYQLFCKGFLLKVESYSNKRLSVKVGKIKNIYDIEVEIKGVTKHKFSISKRGNLFVAKVIFDI